MCLKPLTIRNPTKVIDPNGGQLLRLNVPCGKCASCLQLKRNSWYIRTHYEMLSTFSKGGYVYFDTLTYAPEHIPMLSHFIDISKYDLRDFSCFNHNHFKLFLKRLRRLISYRYGIKCDAFRYFLTTEYGEDDRYTHRPHYHILFFVYAKILPLEFSQLVADCWQYGRTDGFPFKPASYVYEHVYGYDNGKGMNNDLPTVSSVCMYVSKYINKSSTFTKKLENRIECIKQKVLHKSLSKYTLCDKDVDLINDLKRNIDMFHRQSKGFGISYLEDLTPEKLMFIDNDQIIMYDQSQICKTYPLPMYYKRKLFYTLKEHSDGTRYWELTESGKQHMVQSKLCMIDRLSDKYRDIVRNCTQPYLVEQFFRYLDDRDISDYAIYMLFYNGRHRDVNSINFKSKTTSNLSDHEANLLDWCISLRTSATPYASPDSSLSVDETLIRVPILKGSDLDIMSEELYRFGHFPDMLSNSQSELIDDYIRMYTFNENSDIIFRDFDKITTLLTLMSEEQRLNTQVTFEFIEDLKSRFKLLFDKTIF